MCICLLQLICFGWSLGGISCYLIPSCKIFLVHLSHIKLPQQQLLVSFCMIYWEGIFFSVFWHHSIIHPNQTEDLYSTIHGQVRVQIPIQIYSGLLLKTWSFSWPFFLFCWISCLFFLLHYFLLSISDYVYIIFSVPERNILFYCNRCMYLLFICVYPYDSCKSLNVFSLRPPRILAYTARLLRLACGTGKFGTGFVFGQHLAKLRPNCDSKWNAKERLLEQSLPESSTFILLWEAKSV